MALDFGALFGGFAGGLAQGAEAGISLGQKQQVIELQKEQQKTQLLTSLTNMRNMPLELRKIVLPVVLADFEKKYGIVLPDSYKKAAATFEDPNWKALTDSMVKNAPPGMDAQAYANWLGGFAGDPHAQLQAWDQYRKFRQGEDLSTYRQGVLGLRSAGTATTTTPNAEGGQTRVTRPLAGKLTPPVPVAPGTPGTTQPIPETTTPGSAVPIPGVRETAVPVPTSIGDAMVRLNGAGRKALQDRLAENLTYLGTTYDPDKQHIALQEVQKEFSDLWKDPNNRRMETQTAQAPPATTPPAQGTPTPAPTAAPDEVAGLPLRPEVEKRLNDPSVVPPAWRDKVRAMLSGRLPYTARVSGEQSAIMNFALRADPNFDAITGWKMRSDFASELAKGNTYKQVLAIGTAFNHSDYLLQAAQELKNGNLQAANQAVNFFRAQTGSGAPVATQLTATALSEELVRLFRQVNSSVSEVKRFEDRLDPTRLSPEQVQASLGAIAKLAKGRYMEIRSMVEKRMGPREAANILSPQAQAAMDRFEKMAPGDDKTGAPSLPQGIKIIRSGTTSSGQRVHQGSDGHLYDDAGKLLR